MDIKDAMVIELGDDLMRQTGLSQLKPDDTAMSSLDFDARGSVHVMCRDEVDKLLKDLTVKDIQPADTIKSNTLDYSQEINELRASRKKANVVMYVVVGVLVLLLMTTLMILQMM